MMVNRRRIGIRELPDLEMFRRRVLQTNACGPRCCYRTGCCSRMRVLALFAVLLALGDAAHVISNKEEAHFVVRQAAKKQGKHGHSVEQMRDMFKEQQLDRAEPDGHEDAEAAAAARRQRCTDDPTSAECVRDRKRRSHRKHRRRASPSVNAAGEL